MVVSLHPNYHHTTRSEKRLNLVCHRGKKVFNINEIHFASVIQ